jgi:hypothetical protein
MDTEVDPDNPFLIASMLSASAMKTEACFSSDQVWYIRDGLRMKGSDPKFFTPEEYEAGAVAGLIQVLSAGKRILEREMIEEGDLRQSLEDIGEVIKCSTGEKVLQVRSAKRDLGQPLLTQLTPRRRRGNWPGMISRSLGHRGTFGLCSPRSEEGVTACPYLSTSP